MSLLAALKKENKNHIPIWMMRQAGRFLPEYQALRKNYDFRTMSHRPELICETTLTPFSRYKMDGAILFSDILTCLEYMGSAFHFGENGPVLEDHGPQVLKRLQPLDPKRDMAFVGDGIKLILPKLRETPLIGFAGAPFTLISYLVEGGTSREFSETRKFLYGNPKAFREAMDLLADSIGNYLLYQMECGASAVQIFDSWVGILSAENYREHILPSMKRLMKIVKQAGKPVILYSQPTLHLLPMLKSLGPDALSVDWRNNLLDVVKILQATDGPVPALQGNLDPIATTLPWETARPHVEAVLSAAKSAEILDQFVFNVGHGVLPETRPETVGSIVDFVHAYRR